MKIIEKPNAKKKIAYGFWLRRFKGYPIISINGGTYKRHFKTAELYSAASEALSNATFAGPLDMRNFLSRLINGFEKDITTVPMGEDLTLPNNIFIPAYSGEMMIDT